MSRKDILMGLLGTLIMAILVTGSYMLGTANGATANRVQQKDISAFTACMDSDRRSRQRDHND